METRTIIANKWLCCKSGDVWSGVRFYKFLCSFIHSNVYDTIQDALAEVLCEDFEIVNNTEKE